MSKHDHPLTRLTLGAAAGFAGTAALFALRLASQRWLPQTLPPMQDPGEAIVKQAEIKTPGVTPANVPPTVEMAGAQGLAMGYGLTAGVLYALARSRTPREPIAEGTLLGLLVWAIGYLGWLPAAKLMPPLWKQEPTEIAGPIVQHLVFGAVTAATYQKLRRS